MLILNIRKFNKTVFYIFSKHYIKKTKKAYSIITCMPQTVFADQVADFTSL